MPGWKKKLPRASNGIDANFNSRANKVYRCPIFVALFFLLARPALRSSVIILSAARRAAIFFLLGWRAFSHFARALSVLNLYAKQFPIMGTHTDCRRKSPSRARTCRNWLLYYLYVVSPPCARRSISFVGDDRLLVASFAKWQDASASRCAANINGNFTIH